MILYHSNMKEIAKAIIAVMQEVKGIEKSMTVGSGSNSYKGVADQEVKQIIGEAMAKNGLCIIPIETNANTKIERWEEIYNGQAKMRQSVFTEVSTKYLLIHTSGETQILSGYGHGVDSQDKSAGKATTYALKYALLYAFLVPTGKIDDADNHHSDSIQKPILKTEPAEDFDKLHNTFMKLWDKYKAHVGTEEATKYHPSRWKTKSAKAYESAIQALTEKLLNL